MSSNSNTGDVSLVFNGLGDQLTTATAAGDYIVQGQLTLPLARENNGAGSQVVAVVMHNASSVQAAGAAGATGYRVKVPGVAAGDTLGVHLSSSTAIDQPLNAVKNTMQVFIGEE